MTRPTRIGELLGPAGEDPYEHAKRLGEKLAREGKLACEPDCTYTDNTHTGPCRTPKRPKRDPEVALAEAKLRMAQEASDARHDMWLNMVPVMYQDARPQDFDAATTKELQRWSENAWHDGVNLVIGGPVGVGKTHAAFAAVHGPYDTGEVRFMFWPEVKLKAALDWTEPDHKVQTRWAQEVDILIIDDLGSITGNSWWSTELFAILNQRYTTNLPTIVTTNLSPSDLTDTITDRTFSRLALNAVTLRLGGPDRRSAA